MKHLCLLFAILSFLDCKAQKGHEDLAKEVIISGRVFNREVYPKEKEVKLEITLFCPVWNRLHFSHSG